MSKPYEFSNTEELVGCLRQYKARIAEFFDEEIEGGVEEVIRSSVEGNTFRAFSRMPCKPSEVFRNWASERLSDNKVIESFTNIGSEQQYDLWLKQFSEDLCHYWTNKMGRGMPYGPGRKLPNLLLKRLVKWNRLKKLGGEGQRRHLIELLHVPLDKYTLASIRRCASDFPDFAVGIPPNVTMSFVDTEDRYIRIQEIMREISRQAGVPAIYLDVLTWNLKH